jgi:sec-independent protein translocase protein TatA
MLAEIVGPDMLIVLVIAMIFFGGSQIPKLARGLGSAQREFKRGLTGDPEAGAGAGADADMPEVARNIGNGLRGLRSAHHDLRSEIIGTFEGNGRATSLPAAPIEARADEQAAAKDDPTQGASFI